METALQRIRDLAPALSGAALRVLVELIARAEATASPAITASSRQLAERCKISRRSTQAALDELQRLDIIASSADSAAEPARHTLKPMAVVPQVHGAKIAPPPEEICGNVALFLRHPGAEIAPPLAQKVGHPGANFAPPPADNDAGHAHAFENFDFDLRSTIERLQISQKTDYDQNTFEAARRLVHHHQQKSRAPAQEPPDDALIADLLAIAAGQWPRIQGMLSDLAREGKTPSENYAWYRTVTLQRMCGVSFAQAKAALEILSEERKRAKRKPPTAATPAEISELKTMFATAAQGKAMR